MSTLPVPASRAAAPAAAAPVEAPVPVATPVSVVMPVLNEERYLEQSVRRVLDQEYDGEVEVVLAVGPSHDRTAQIAEDLATRDGRVRVIRNATGRTPDALNAAVQASRHPYVVRVDAHGLLPAGYLTEVVRLLESTGAANVGGMMKVEGDNAFGHAVARAMSSPLGIGGSKFHVGGAPGPARTVYLGAFRREVLDRVGGFDPHFHRAQDWELNYRIRRAGGTVWFSPHLAVTYRPRRNVPALARQFHASGRWRRQIVERHPETASFRYLAAPVVTSCIIIGLVLGVAALLMGWPWLHLGWLAPACYLTGLLAACAVMGRGLSSASWLWLPLVTATMHLSWGVGFLRNIRR